MTQMICLSRLSKLKCLTHCTSSLADKFTAFLQKLESEVMFKTSLSFSTGSQKGDGTHALAPELVSFPCTDGIGIAQILKGSNGFFHLSLYQGLW